jgi:hypothetical protein
MRYKYSTYLKYVHYNKILDCWWYEELNRKLNILEDYKINVNISDLNRFLYERYQFEQGNINKFIDGKYNLENYMQIIEYKKNYGYDGDDEKSVFIDLKFNAIMNGLAHKLSNFTMSV